MRKTLQKIGIGVAAAAALIAAGLLGGSSVRADNGPHTQNYAVDTDACAGCHRAHTAQAAYLLKVAEPALCLTCHDGSQALTNVQGGRLQAPAATGNFALKAGGFVSAWIDTADPNIGVIYIGVLGAAQAVTSTHTTDGSAQMVWGNGPISGTANAGAAGLEMSCTTCHNQHGNGQYRILRPAPVAYSGLAGATDRVAAGISVADVLHPGDGREYATDDYMGVAPPALLGQWCAQCHSRYFANTGHPGSTASGDAIFAYRHLVEGYAPRCASCHVAHGTNAQMTPGGPAASVARPGQGTNGVGGLDAGGSRLLKMDNRGICLKCHPR